MIGVTGPAFRLKSLGEGLEFDNCLEKCRWIDGVLIASNFQLTNSDFDAKPMVMVLGQYSTGKTTFIKHLLKTSYPGAHIGPEPTMDRFVVVMRSGHIISIHALAISTRQSRLTIP